MTFSEEVPKPEVTAVAGLVVAVIIGVTFIETGTGTGITGGFGLICFSFDEGGGGGGGGVTLPGTEWPRAAAEPRPGTRPRERGE